MNGFIILNAMYNSEFRLFKEYETNYKSYAINPNYIIGFHKAVSKENIVKKYNSYKNTGKLVREIDLIENWPKTEIFIENIGPLYVLQSEEEIVEAIKVVNRGVG